MVITKGQLPDFFPDALTRECSVVVLTRRERLFRSGEPAAHTHFVLSGEITAVRHLADGCEVVMQRTSEGEFFARSAMLQSHYIFDAVAEIPSEVVCIPFEPLRKVLARGGEFALAYTDRLAADLRRQNARVERLRLLSARDRVLHYLACEGPPQGRHGLLKAWAAELGLAPETLSRTLATMEAAGDIVRQSRQIVPLAGSASPPPRPG